MSPTRTRRHASRSRTHYPWGDRTRTAYHEAGHAVLSTAIHEAPVLVSVRPDARRLGETTLGAWGRPNALAQVLLAGFAGEHLLTGRRPRQLRAEVQVTLVHFIAPDTVAGLRPWETDGFAAVHEVLRMSTCRVADDVRREIERLYRAAHESLLTVRAAVDAVARALIEKEELRPRALKALLREFRVADAVRVVQWTHGVDD